MLSGKTHTALLLLVATLFAAGACAAFALAPPMQAQTLRFTVVETTPRHVVVERLHERVVVRKGAHVVVQNGVMRFVVVKLTRRYAYLRRVTPAPGQVNVKDYGARGDGVTDDRDAIARAGAAAVGKTLYVPAGTYRIGSRLTMPSGVTVKGDGDASWLSGPLSVGSDSTYERLRIGRDHFSCYVGSVSRVTFANVRFAGGGGAYGGHWPFFDSHVLTIGVGGSVSDVLFDSCSIERNSGTENAEKSLHFDNVFVMSDVAAGGALVNGVLFRGCDFAGSPRFNVEIWDNFMASARNQGTRNVDFENCVFEASESCTIDYSGAADAWGVPLSGYSHVTGCTFKGNGAGVSTRWSGDIVVEKGAGHVVVEGNTFYRGLAAALAGSGGHNEFRSNIVDATGSVFDTGIVHAWSAYVALADDHNAVTGNTIISTGPQPNAIEVIGDYNVVTGNTVTGGAIAVTGSGNVTAPNMLR